MDINFEEFSYPPTQTAVKPTPSQALDNIGASSESEQQLNVPPKSDRTVQPWELQTVREADGGAGGGGNGARADISGGPQYASEKPTASRPPQQHRYPTDIERAVPSVTRTSTGTIANGGHEQPRPRTWEDVGRTKRKGADDGATKEHLQEANHADENWVARTRVENSGFEQCGGREGRVVAGMEGSRYPNPIGGQKNKTALDCGPVNGTGAFDAGKGGKVNTFMSTIYEVDEGLVFESVFSTEGYQTGSGEGHTTMGQGSVILFAAWQGSYVTSF